MWSISCTISLVSFFLNLAGCSGEPQPFGFGAQTTGGGNAPAQTPNSLEQLTSWLADSVPRVILIDRTFDFSDTEGNATETGCAPWPDCPSGNQVQHARDVVGWCSQHCEAGHSLPIHYRKAAISQITIASHKTLRGVGNKGVIKGKGFLIWRQNNVIIQNIHITYLNPHLVWAGDAIVINGATNVWIDHCTFSYIGRQMIVADLENNTGITLSNNHFQGKTEWSSNCYDKHYWTVLLSGHGDTITMANNCFDQTSGRSPKLGGTTGPRVDLHYYNNIHFQCRGQSLEIVTGGRMLAEGNLFQDISVDYPAQAQTELGGFGYVPFTTDEAAKCQEYLGRACVQNLEKNSQGQPGPVVFGKTPSVLTDFEGVSYIKTANIRPASDLVNGTPGGCGFGI